MLSRYIKNRQVSSLLSLGIGTIIAQFINILVQPILTRLVSPEELGVYNLLISLANVVIPVASLKLIMLIVIEKEDEDAEILTDVSIITTILVSILCTLFIGILLLVGNSTFSDIGYLAFLIPIIILTNSIRFIFISHNNRYKKYSVISKIDILREFIKGILQIIVGITGGGVIGLALAYAVSPIAGFKFQAKDYFNSLNQRNKATLKVVKQIFKKHRRHILYLVPAQLINSFSYTLITISVISLFSATEAGYYSISFMILGLPLILISNNVGRVFLQSLKELDMNGKSLWRYYKIIIIFLTIISSVGFSSLAYIAPSASEIVFGNGYSEAGSYISILCFMFALRFIASSVTGAFVYFGRQKLDTIFQSLLVMSGLIVHYISYSFNLNIYEYLSYISVFYGLIYFLIIITIGLICRKYNKGIDEKYYSY